MHRLLFLITALFAIALGILLIVTPASYLDLYLFTDGPDRAFAAQRLAPAIIGLGALLLILRNLEQGAMLTQVSYASALVWYGVAATGIWHYLTGTAAYTILIAAAIEIVLGCLFVLVARQGRA